jgi:hypothetical protein
LARGAAMNLHEHDDCKHKIVTIQDGTIAYQECEICGKLLHILCLRDLNEEDSFWDEDLIGI